MKTIITLKSGKVCEVEDVLPNFSVEDTPPLMFLHDQENRVIGPDIALADIERVEVIL